MNIFDHRYVFDGYCGTSPKSRKNVRIITELAWQHHFCKNMFIRPESEAEVADFKPDFTVINACKVVNDDYKVRSFCCWGAPRDSLLSDTRPYILSGMLLLYLVLLY